MLKVRTFFRFAECNVRSILARKQKCVSALKAGARSLICWVQIYGLIFILPNIFAIFFVFPIISLLLMQNGLRRSSLASPKQIRCKSHVSPIFRLFHERELERFRSELETKDKRTWSKEWKISDTSYKTVSHFIYSGAYAPWAFKKIIHDDQKIYSRKLYFGTQRRRDAEIYFEHGKHKRHE